MSYVFRSGDLPKLDLQVDRGVDFKAWKTQWNAYISLSGLKEQAAAKQVQALTLCFSRETLTVVDNLGLTDEQRGDAARIVEAIQQYVEGQINESVERRTFRRRTQQPGETFDDFLVALRELERHANSAPTNAPRRTFETRSSRASLMATQSRSSSERKT